MTPEERGRERGEAEIQAIFAKHRNDGKTGIGVMVDAEVWKAFRIRCLEQGRSSGDVLTEVIRTYLAQPRRGR